MEQTPLVDELTLVLLPVYDVYLHALRHVHETLRALGRDLVRFYSNGLAGEAYRTFTLVDLRGGRFWFLENAKLDVAMGSGL